MTPSAKTTVKKFLNSIELDGLGASLGQVAKITDAETSGDSANVKITLGFPAASVQDAIRDQIAAAVTQETGANGVQIEIDHAIKAHSVQRNLKRIPEVRNVIAVASGKGGVGKSTVAANLALALKAEGASVGLLDADIYGPSQPHMMGIAGQQPVSNDGKTMEPLEAHGLQVMSVGFLVDADTPMIWRGPMVTSALNQLLNQTTWKDLDYLIVDMPPGTGDIQLTLSQQVPVAGAVIVTTPQNIALLDARKGLAMFQKVSVPVLGVIENMSTHVCSSCGHEEAIFGDGGGEQMAGDFAVPLLGHLPLAASVREQTDSGHPTVISDPDSPSAKAYRSAAIRMAVTLAKQGKDYSSKFPNIVVEGS